MFWFRCYLWCRNAVLHFVHIANADTCSPAVCKTSRAHLFPNQRKEAPNQKATIFWYRFVSNMME